MARTDANAGAGKAFTGFIVERDSPGVTVGRKVNCQLANRLPVVTARHWWKLQVVAVTTA